MARRPFVCGNWKMYKTIGEALDVAVAVRNAVSMVSRGVEVAIAPPFTALHPVSRKLEGSPLRLAAQDCFWEKEGAFTGEVSVAQLADAGCSHVIVGHSERRQLFGELDAAVGLKAKAVLAGGLTPIICVGETLAERDAGATLGRLAAQLHGALAGFTADMVGKVVLAYEPVWAIGTGRVATPAQAQEAHAFLRQHLHQHFGEVAQAVRIQYGGSVKPDNAAGLLSQPDIDGALVGGASLTAESFLAIIRATRASAEAS
jgi:triosephosphate isomerase (TIM)